MSHIDYYYVHPDQVMSDRLLITDDELHHMTRVCRKQIGDSFCAVDGLGNMYTCELQNIDAHGAEAKILKKQERFGEPDIDLTIVQAPPKGNRFDVVIEKGTEIGVTRFLPVRTTRSLAVSASKTERWRRISRAAMKQCGRSVWPSVYDEMDFRDALAETHSSDLKIIAHESEHNNLLIEYLRGQEFQKPNLSAVVFIGPAGGFTEEEIKTAKKNGCESVSLGPRRLRSETAAIVAAALCISHFSS